MHKVFVNGGGSSKYDTIAARHGWQLGCNSGGNNIPSEDKLFFVDNDWKNFDFDKHLAFVKKYCPVIASVKDIEDDDDQHLIYSWALELSRYCQYLMIIPKTNILSKFLELPNIILGLPLGRAENIYSWHYAINCPHKIHLLGGSPSAWVRGVDRLSYEKIFSCDGNYLSKIAGFGKVWHNFKTRKPHRWEVVDGKDYNYRCFDFSIQQLNAMEFNNLPKQTSLFDFRLNAITNNQLLENHKG